MDKTIITITGPSGSGKTTLETNLCKKGGVFSKVISHTSREKRENEEDNVDYHFVDKTFFLENEDKFLEKVSFSGNFYGVAENSLIKDKINIIVVEPEGYRQLSAYCHEHGIRHESIGLRLNKTAQKKRMLFRGDQLLDTINRIEFENISEEMLSLDFDLEINVENINEKQVYYMVLGYLFSKGVIKC